MTKAQTATVYKPWVEDSQHALYDTANQRRIDLFEEKIEGLQVKVKRTSENKFVVKTRVPGPPKSVSKKKATTKKNTTTSPKKEVLAEAKSTTSSKKKPTRKTSRKRK